MSTLNYIMYMLPLILFVYSLPFEFRNTLTPSAVWWPPPSLSYGSVRFIAPFCSRFRRWYCKRPQQTNLDHNKLTLTIAVQCFAVCLSVSTKQHNRRARDAVRKCWIRINSHCFSFESQSNHTRANATRAISHLFLVKTINGPLISSLWRQMRAWSHINNIYFFRKRVVKTTHRNGRCSRLQVIHQTHRAWKTIIVNILKSENQCVTTYKKNSNEWLGRLR